MILTAQANIDSELQPAGHSEEDLFHWMAAAAFSSSGAALEALPEGFEPGNNDCVCVRGKVSLKHLGNARFKAIVKQHLKQYLECSSKFEKSLIVTEIVKKVADGSSAGGFVKKVGDRWYKAGDKLAREKVGQCLRNLLHNKYSSSTRAKRAQRQVNESKFDEGVDEMMGHLNYVDLSKRVEQLTVQAKSDSDFQNAFNRANSELLESFKKLPPNPDHARKDPR